MEHLTLPGGVTLTISDDRPVAEVRLDRPRVRNAQTMATWASLVRAAEIIAEQPTLGVVVIRGAGEDFSAGLDLRMIRGQAPAGEGDLRQLLQSGDDEVADAIAGFQRAFTCWRELPTVAVAAVTGNAIGAGFQLALAADLRVISHDATFTMAEARLGLVPDLGGTRRLVEIVGYPRALEICATAGPVDAAEAGRVGLANAVIPSGDFDTGLDRYVASLLTVPAEVLRSVKTVVASAAVADPAAQLTIERQAQVPLLRRAMR